MIGLAFPTHILSMSVLLIFSGKSCYAQCTYLSSMLIVIVHGLLSCIAKYLVIHNRAILMATVYVANNCMGFTERMWVRNNRIRSRVA